MIDWANVRDFWGLLGSVMVVCAIACRFGDYGDGLGWIASRIPLKRCVLACVGRNAQPYICGGWPAVQSIVERQLADIGLVDIGLDAHQEFLPKRK